MKLIGVLFLFTYIIFALANEDSALTREEKIKRLIQMAVPSAEDRVFYRWQSQDSTRNLIESQEFNEKLYKYFMDMKIDYQHFAMGRGVYYSEDLTNSAHFIRDQGGGDLLEVRIKKGMPTLDLTSGEVIEKLKKMGLNRDDVKFLDPPLAVRYSYDGWWVVKKREGVQFSKVDTSRISLGRIDKGIEKMNQANNQRAAQVLSALKPEIFRREIKRDPSLVLQNEKSFSQLSEIDVLEYLSSGPMAKKYFLDLFNKNLLSEMPISETLITGLKRLHIPITEEELFKTSSFKNKLDFLAQGFRGKTIPKKYLEVLFSSRDLNYKLTNLETSDRNTLNGLVNKGILNHPDDASLIKSMLKPFSNPKLHLSPHVEVVMKYPQLSKQAKSEMDDYVYAFFNNYQNKYLAKDVHDKMINTLLDSNYQNSLSGFIESVNSAVLTDKNKKSLEDNWVQNLEQCRSYEGCEIKFKTLTKKFDQLSDKNMQILKKFCDGYFTQICGPSVGEPSELIKKLAAREISEKMSPENYVLAWEKCLLRGFCWTEWQLRNVTPPFSRLTEAQVHRLMESYFNGKHHPQRTISKFHGENMSHKYELADVLIVSGQKYWRRFPGEMGRLMLALKEKNIGASISYDRLKRVNLVVARMGQELMANRFEPRAQSRLNPFAPVKNSLDNEGLQLLQKQILPHFEKENQKPDIEKHEQFRSQYQQQLENSTAEKTNSIEKSDQSLDELRKTNPFREIGGKINCFELFKSLGSLK
jgi:hypothetical protein